VEVSDLVQRKGTSEWKAIVTGFDGDHSARIVWVDTGESDACSIDLLEVINEER